MLKMSSFENKISLWQILLALLVQGSTQTPRYLTAPADYLDVRVTKFQILKISNQLG